MITAQRLGNGTKKMQAAGREYEKVAAQQKRGIFRGARAGRTLAAKKLRAESRIPSKQLKARFKATHTGLTATRNPIPVEHLGARLRKSDKTITVKRGAIAKRTYSPGFERGGRYYALIRSRWRRLKGQSVARAWVDMGDVVRARMVEVYRKHMQTWIAGVRRRAGAKRA